MENLENIKVGDRVIERVRYGKNVRTVKRLTKTLVVLDDDSKYRKDDGRLLGGHDFFIPSIKIATPEELAKIEEEKKRGYLIARIRDYSFDKLSTEKLEKIYEMINK